jgi:hypothetical protein
VQTLANTIILFSALTRRKQNAGESLIACGALQVAVQFPPDPFLPSGSLAPAIAFQKQFIHPCQGENIGVIRAFGAIQKTVSADKRCAAIVFFKFNTHK